LLGLNLISLLQIQTLKQEQETMRNQLENGRLVLAMLSYPETNTIPITGTNIAGTILVDVERNAAVILAWDMPKLDPTQTYQIWLITPDGKRTSGGVFNADTVSPFTSSPVSVPDSLAQYSGLGVTIEPAGGSPQPTGDRVFKIDF
jgi:anti-sigma-K factor RskA